MQLMMKACIIVLSSLVLFGGDAEPAKTRRPLDSQRFILHFPRTIDTASLSIDYYLTGSFGGYGNYVRTQPNSCEYAIETSYENKPARTLKAIIFCPGYEINLVNVPSLVDSSVRDADVELRPLRSIPLSGKVILPTPHRATVFGVAAKYVAYWSHEFFGISDGMVSSFNVASANVSEDGSFSIMLPDLAHDSAVNSFKHRGVITLTAREPKTGNIRYRLERATNPDGDVEIQIAEQYSDELILYARPPR